MWHIDFQEIITAFLVLFAVIDITGSIPVIMSLNASGSQVKAGQASILSLLLIVVFLFVGEGMLKLFNTDLESFAIAGSLILFALAVEMTFNIKIFRNDGPPGYSTIIPMVFPLIAGAGTLTTALSMRAQYGILNILIAIVLNMVIVYLVIRYVQPGRAADRQGRHLHPAQVLRRDPDRHGCQAVHHQPHPVAEIEERQQNKRG